ncbi:hypothetical protein LAZ67_X004457 [Cordylochernes scorpioides]|uniref:Uncharacterized protein n=1 Tax=Cordylochernes scorpioides TaxID=51811 RepID=A0ABY6LZ35_9ARAC|nr:hypothetical protein LAZ67_X004457 [Cordylochernes scorpioides]
MVWEQDSYVIVMVTKVFDFIRVMCCQYWPGQANNRCAYHGLTVELVNEEPLANFSIRTFRLTKDGESREIYQLHYTDWPSHTVPYTSSLLEFRRRVRIYCARNPHSGPLIVHCSDGCSRTGAYLCIDANLELAQEDGVYDIFGYTRRLRQSRRELLMNEVCWELVLGINSIRKKIQLKLSLRKNVNVFRVFLQEEYRFCYECLEEARICTPTFFPVKILREETQIKSIKNPLTGLNDYMREYKKICKLSSKLSIGDCAGGHRPENRDKNRDVAIVPRKPSSVDGDSGQLQTLSDIVPEQRQHGLHQRRVCGREFPLASPRAPADRPCCVQGYTRSKEYIVSEWPMHRTLADFWSMVYDHECNSVVVLCNPPQTNNYPGFWPTEGEKLRRYGPVFTVELMSTRCYPNIRTYIFKVSKRVVSLTELMAGVKAAPRTTQLFQLTCWPVGHKVPTSTKALVELMNMVERWRQRTEYGPVVVVSMNGKGRAGVYCAANVAIEQAVQHGEVDIFQAVKTVRRHRPQLVANLVC